jgi:phage FluMu protein Com
MPAFQPRRELLLTEIERRCRNCDARVRPALTKAEARAYRGFECERCETWNDDDLTERDVPEWWGELRGAERVGAARGAGAAEEDWEDILTDGGEGSG